MEIPLIRGRGFSRKTARTLHCGRDEIYPAQDPGSQRIGFGEADVKDIEVTRVRALETGRVERRDVLLHLRPCQSQGIAANDRQAVRASDAALPVPEMITQTAQFSKTRDWHLFSRAPHRKPPL